MVRRGHNQLQKVAHYSLREICFPPKTILPFRLKSEEQAEPSIGFFSPSDTIEQPFTIVREFRTSCVPVNAALFRDSTEDRLDSRGSSGVVFRPRLAYCPVCQILKGGLRLALEIVWTHECPYLSGHS